MDTNLIRDLIAMMEAKNATAAASGQNTILIVTMIIGAIAPTLASIMAYFKAAAAKADAEENKASAAKAAESLKDIHVAVNSKDTATAKKIEDLQAMVSKLIEEKATSVEQLRGLTAAAEVERAVSKERGSSGQHLVALPRLEKATETVEAAAEKVDGAAEKTETAVGALTDSEISKMIAELTKELTLRKG